MLILGAGLAGLRAAVEISQRSAARDAPTSASSPRYSSRSALFLAGNLALLGLALFHGLYGLRGILYELGPGARAQRALGVALTVGGICLFVIGSWAAWASFALSRAW